MIKQIKTTNLSKSESSPKTGLENTAETNTERVMILSPVALEYMHS